MKIKCPFSRDNKVDAEKMMNTFKEVAERTGHKILEVVVEQDKQKADDWTGYLIY